jgi:hypothetical protein
MQFDLQELVRRTASLKFTQLNFCIFVRFGPQTCDVVAAKKSAFNQHREHRVS